MPLRLLRNKFASSLMALAAVVAMVTLPDQCQSNKDQWSQRFLKQAHDLGCVLSKLEKETTNQPTDRVTILGKVADIEICALLCCELPTCQMAVFENNQLCKSVQCSGQCQTQVVSDGVTSVTIAKQPGYTVQETASLQQQQQQQASQSTVVTKQATTSNSSNVIQKSSIPEITDNEESHEHGAEASSGSFVTISGQSNEGDNHHGNSSKKSVTDQIQKLSDHLRKTDDKDAMALDESDNQSAIRHHKHHNKSKDLRHTLISPITIGAFTCMAVIAVSGFAMAIIKYQRETRKEGGGKP